MRCDVLIDNESLPGHQTRADSRAAGVRPQASSAKLLSPCLAHAPAARTSPPEFAEVELSRLRFGRLQRLPILDIRYTVNTVAMPNVSKSNKAAAGKTGPQGRSAIEDVVAREYTIHMHKRVRSV